MEEEVPVEEEKTQLVEETDPVAPIVPEPKKELGTSPRVPPVDKPKEPEPKEKPKDPKPKKRGPAREPKVQCPTCLRYYCGWRVHSGGHVCHPVRLPDPPKPAEPTPRNTSEAPPEDHEPKSRGIEDPEPDPMASSIVALPELTHSDVVRFMARERMNRHERKRERWQQQMFG